MKELLESYQDNLRTLKSLRNTLKQLKEYNVKIIATYGHTEGTSKGTISNKIEKYAIRICTTEARIKELENKIHIVNQAERVLNRKEKEVIYLIKKGNENKLTRIAEILGKDKDYIKHKRDTAIKKMSEYMGAK